MTMTMKVSLFSKLLKSKQQVLTIKVFSTSQKYHHLNDIHRACKHFHPILFADDTNLTSSHCSSNEEQNTTERPFSLSQVTNNELKEYKCGLN